MPATSTITAMRTTHCMCLEAPTPTTFSASPQGLRVPAECTRSPVVQRAVDRCADEDPCRRPEPGTADSRGVRRYVTCSTGYPSSLSREIDHVRVAVIAEPFLPQMNGVSHSLLRVLDHLAERGDEAIVIAPGSRGDRPREVAGARVLRVPSFAMPKYRKVRVAPGGSPGSGGCSPTSTRTSSMSPHPSSWAGGACSPRRIWGSRPSPSTDRGPGLRPRYGMRGLETVLWNHVRNIHQHASLTLAPSSYTVDQLTGIGVSDVRLSARGVDSSPVRPHPSVCVVPREGRCEREWHRARGRRRLRWDASPWRSRSRTCASCRRSRM